MSNRQYSTPVAQSTLIIRGHHVLLKQKSSIGNTCTYAMNQTYCMNLAVIYHLQIFMFYTILISNELNIYYEL